MKNRNKRFIAFKRNNLLIPIKNQREKLVWLYLNIGQKREILNYRKIQRHHIQNQGIENSIKIIKRTF